MSKKVRHLIHFEKEDEIFDGVDGDLLRDAIQEELPEEISIKRCYCEYPKPYGHRPYVSVVTAEEKNMIENPKERGDAIIDGVIAGVTNVVSGTVDEKISEGWA